MVFIIKYLVAILILRNWTCGGKIIGDAVNKDINSSAKIEGV